MRIIPNPRKIVFGFLVGDFDVAEGLWEERFRRRRLSVSWEASVGAASVGTLEEKAVDGADCEAVIFEAASENSARGCHSRCPSNQ